MTKPQGGRCERCKAKATVTLGDESLCRLCAAAVVENRAFSVAWNSRMTFNAAYEAGKQAMMRFLRDN